MEGGINLEGDVSVTGGTVPSELANIFAADWLEKSVIVSNNSLVVAPGAESGILGLLKQPGTVFIASEELGSDPAILQAMEEKGTQLRLLLPTSISFNNVSNAKTLAEHGVQVRLLKSPYVHAKIILSGSKMFVGSENLTSTSLVSNREVGIVLEQESVLKQATAWFGQYWSQATPLISRSTSETQTSTTSSSYLYLALGTSQSEVKARWGSPSSISQTTYHGQLEMVHVGQLSVWSREIGQKPVTANLLGREILPVRLNPHTPKIGNIGIVSHIDDDIVKLAKKRKPLWSTYSTSATSFNHFDRF